MIKVLLLPLPQSIVMLLQCQPRLKLQPLSRIFWPPIPTTALRNPVFSTPLQNVDPPFRPANPPFQQLVQYNPPFYTHHHLFSLTSNIPFFNNLISLLNNFIPNLSLHFIHISTYSSQPLSVKLNGTNFLLGKNQLLNAVMANGLEGFLYETIMCPQFLNQAQTQLNPNYTTWHRYNRYIMCWQYSSLSKE